MAQARRNLKNVVYNYTDTEVKVREATSNDPWGPASTLMAEISELTYNTQVYSELMGMLWKRMNDSGKNWRHVYKSLILLDYLIKNGSERVVRQCADNIFSIQTLKDFQFNDKDGKDQGINVREKAKALVSLLKDKERLKEERERAKQARQRLHGEGSGISSDFGRAKPRSDPKYGSENATSPSPSKGVQPVNQAKPTSPTDEELQLQLALRISKEEAEKEAKLRAEEEESLKAVLEISKKEAGTEVGEKGSDQEDGKRSSENLLGLGDPWGNGDPQPPSYDSLLMNDPWGQGSSPATSTKQKKPAASPQNDPWGLSGGSTTTSNGVGNSNTAPAKKMDPWSSFDNPTSSAPPSNTVSNDPWTSVPVTDSMTDLPNDFGPVVEPSNPFNLSDLGLDLPAISTNNDTQSSNQPQKIEEKFLGDLSNLVDLDSLTVTKPTSQQANPFIPSFTLPQATTSNPFQQNKPRQPTLDELRYNPAGQGGDDLLPAPLLPDTGRSSPWQQPAPQEAANPFI